MHIFRKLIGTMPVSLLFLARYSEEAQARPEATMGELLRQLYHEVYGELIEDSAAEAIGMRLAEHGRKAQEVASSAKPETAKPKPTVQAGQHFSDFYNKFIMGLDTSQTLLWLTEFDVERARQLYQYEDFEVVEFMIDTKQQLERERNRLLYEGPMFGFGGKYSGGSKATRDEGEVKVHDLSGLTAAEAAQRISALQRRR